MKLLDAVIQVLQEAGEPLHITEITRRILSKIYGLQREKPRTVL